MKNGSDRPSLCPLFCPWLCVSGLEIEFQCPCSPCVCSRSAGDRHFDKFLASPECQTITRRITFVTSWICSCTYIWCSSSLSAPKSLSGLGFIFTFSFFAYLGVQTYYCSWTRNTEHFLFNLESISCIRSWKFHWKIWIFLARTHLTLMQVSMCTYVMFTSPDKLRPNYWQVRKTHLLKRDWWTTRIPPTFCHCSKRWFKLVCY